MDFNLLNFCSFAFSVFYYPLTPNTGFHFMLNCYFLYNYSLRLETDHFKSSPGDYFFLLLFNWACCTIIGLLFSLPVNDLLHFHRLWISVICSQINHANIRVLFSALDGSNDFVSVVHLVSAKQRCDSKLLVWHTIQGDVLAMGFVRIQFDFVQWQHVLTGWHFGGSSLLLLENQISTRIGWAIILGNTGIYVSIVGKVEHSDQFDTHFCSSK